MAGRHIGQGTGLAGSLFGDGWKQQQTHHTVASSSNPLALQALLRWFYTCRLDVAFDAVSACLELCQQVQLTELVEEANLALHSEGRWKPTVPTITSLNAMQTRVLDIKVQVA